MVAAFPNEVFEVIFEHLSPVELSRLAQASRSLYHISTRSILWERAYLSFWREGDAERERERGTNSWRLRRRHAELKEAARRAWSADGKAFNDGTNLSKRRRRDGTLEENGEVTPFPYSLSAGSDASPSSLFTCSPNFHQLFLERITIDDEVLKVINTQCCSVTKWMERVEMLVEKYGNDAKDVLHALVACQSRRNHEDGDSLGLDSVDKMSPIFPTALQVRLPGTKRSRTHHLSLLHFGQDLLEHLQCREALQGLLSIRPGCTIPASLSSHWIDTQGQGQIDGHLEALEAAKTSKGFETAISWLSMFRGGEGQELAEELDMMSVSCALYLASRSITLEDDAQSFAAGICQFMKSRSFKGASSAEYTNLSNNFLHFCLDESGRETLPLSLAVIFCAIASRLGLPAAPSNTPAKVLVVVQARPSSNEASSSDRFWVDVYENGQILSLDDVAALLIRMRFPMRESLVAASTPVAICVRSGRNIINSVQEGQGAPRFYTLPREEADGARQSGDNKEGTQKADDIFERLMKAPTALFNPRRTYKTSKGTQLVSPFWSAPGVTLPGRFLRRNKSSYFDQQAGMHAASNALARLSNELGDRGSEWCASLVQTYFPLDTLILRDEFTDESYQSPMYVADPTTRSFLSESFQKIIQEDQDGPTPKRRTLTNHSSIYSIGTLFKHRSYGYKAAVIAWSETCDASETWIQSMEVDRLPNGGRNQPFYQSIVEDGSTRYVAHCNVIPATLSSRPSSPPFPSAMSLVEAEEVLQQREIGRLFRCLSLQGTHLRLVKNEHGQHAYPDD